MKLLMHICCGPCATYPTRALSEAGHEVHGFFYNPNIHPLAEHGLRVDSVKKLLEHTGITAELHEEYDVEEYFRHVVYRERNRCQACYHLRLEKAARTAARRRFDAFTTSLLVSPYQKHDLIREIGQSLGMEYGIEFYYEDFRSGWPHTRRMAREMGLYRQKYCGCIYSEKERFLFPSKKPVGNGQDNVGNA
ncbi:MAG: epoxyqueuosine reductase QueH [Candidatus Hydrogenedentota bacterium]|nr:MAG: epoxyqueuosine reductase QueH [Candidatus Hydrogenedentota bacterium]